MDKQPIPLYGELVISASYENLEGNPEVETMEEQARLMIQEAAYYLAEKRGFSPGHELEDWLRAKKQVLERFL